MSIETDTNELDNIYTGKPKTVMIHPTNSMRINL